MEPNDILESQKSGGQVLWSEDGVKAILSPSVHTLRLNCMYIPNGQKKRFDGLNGQVLSHAHEVQYNRRAVDGLPQRPRTWARFLWDDHYLYFHVEVEHISPDRSNDNLNVVWHGNNIEFLLAPRWYNKPFYDEYEFLFNSSGGYADLHWQDNSIEQAILWTAEDMEWRLSPDLHFHSDAVGWSFQGRISFASLDCPCPGIGDFWGLGLFRKHIDGGKENLLAWSPPLNDPPKFHTPVRFGMLVFDSHEH